MFAFFLKYRNNLYNSSKSDSKYTVFNKFMISWILFLCVLVLFQIIITVVNGVTIFKYGVDFDISAINIYFLSPSFKILSPIKDFLIAISFAYLYYHQGMKMKKSENKREGDGKIRLVSDDTKNEIIGIKEK